MANAKTLELVFKTSGGKNVTISVADPKDDLTLAQAMVVANDIIAKAIFTTTSGELASVADVNLRAVDVVALA